MIELTPLRDFPAPWRHGRAARPRGWITAIRPGLSRSQGEAAGGPDPDQAATRLGPAFAVPLRGGASRGAFLAGRISTTRWWLGCSWAGDSRAAIIIGRACGTAPRKPPERRSAIAGRGRPWTAGGLTGRRWAPAIRSLVEASDTIRRTITLLDARGGVTCELTGCGGWARSRSRRSRSPTPSPSAQFRAITVGLLRERSTRQGRRQRWSVQARRGGR